MAFNVIASSKKIYNGTQKYYIVFTFFPTGLEKNFNPTWVSINIMRYLVVQVVNR